MATIYNETWRALARRMMGYEHNELQKEIYDWWVGPDSGNVCLILGGERSGKSLMTADLLLATVRPGTPDKQALYWLVGPDYVQARPEFSYLLSAFQSAGLVVGTPSLPQGVAQPWSFQTALFQTFMTKTSTDVKKLASFSVNGLAMTEAHQQDHEVYLKLLGRLSETRGALVMSGTLERGLPWYLDLYKRWRGENAIGAKSFSLPTWSNTAIYPGGIDDPAIQQLKAEYPEDLFMERFGAVPRTHFNTVIPEFDTAIHVRKLAVEENVPVELWVDPGKLVYCVLFVQVIGPYTHVLDRIYATGKIAQEVIPDVMAHRLFKYVDKENAGVIDFAAKQEHGNKSQITLWNEIAGCKFRFQYLPEETTINTIRFRLRSQNPWHEPLVYFNNHMTNLAAPNGFALDVLAEFELWRYPEATPGRSERLRPYDANNHAIKALGYGLVDHFGPYIEKASSSKGKVRGYFIRPTASVIMG